jgi:transcription-repair coupling factor (superfamily II helicase)
MRINLYARLARLDEAESLDDLAAEIEDRFGAMPPPVRNLLNLMRLKRLCLRSGVLRVDAGPQAIALTFRPGAAEGLPLQSLVDGSGGELRWSGERLILARAEEEAEERQRHVIALLERFE